MSEEEDILEFRNRQMTWKHWAAVFAAGALVYFVVSTIRDSALL